MPTVTKLSDYCLIQDVTVQSIHKPPVTPKLMMTTPLWLVDPKQHFVGLRGALWRLVGVTRSHLNPNVCCICNFHREAGRASETTILFAGSLDFATLMRDRGPEAVSPVVDEFVRLCKDIIVGHDGIVDLVMADTVMALFNVPIRRGDRDPAGRPPDQPGHKR